MLKEKRFLVLSSVYLTLILGFAHTDHPSQPSFQNREVDSAGRKTVHVDWREQLAATKKKLEGDPNSSFLHGQAAVAYDALDDFENFDREIQLAMRLDPENTMPCYMAYAVYKRRYLEDKATSVLQTALKIDPRNPFGHYEKAAALENSKVYKGALKEYRTAKELLLRVKANPANLQGNAWRYVDGRSNPFDVTVQESRIEDDIARVRGAIQDRR